MQVNPTPSNPLTNTYTKSWNKLSHIYTKKAANALMTHNTSEWGKLYTWNTLNMCTSLQSTVWCSSRSGSVCGEWGCRVPWMGLRHDAAISSRFHCSVGVRGQWRHCWGGCGLGWSHRRWQMGRKVERDSWLVSWLLFRKWILWKKLSEIARLKLVWCGWEACAIITVSTEIIQISRAEKVVSFKNTMFLLKHPCKYHLDTVL